MLLKDIARALELKTAFAPDELDAEVTGAYISDMLSDVIAHAQPGQVWITLQVHPNVVAVATLKELAAIVTVSDRQPEAETLHKARQEGIPILVSSLPGFELAGRLHRLLA